MDTNPTEAPVTRTRIQALARELYVRHGYEGFTFRDIADALGITRANAPAQPWTLANYERLFHSAAFGHAAVVSVIFVVAICAGCFVLGLLIALLLNARFPGRRLARLILILPWAVPDVVAAVVWAWLFDGSFGLVNWLLLSAGVIHHPVAWLAEPSGALLVCILTLVWTGYPFVTVMVVAGLQAIPLSVFEAAALDGAGPARTFFAITLPFLRPVLLVALVIEILRVVREFTTIFVLTGGGPADATQTVSLFTYIQAFSFYNISYAAAAGVIMLLACAVVSTILTRRAAMAAVS